MSKLPKSLGSFSKILGHTTYLILLALSLYFYEERAGTFDNAFQTFLMVCDGDIQIMVHRWPAAIIRIVPWLLLQIGLPMSGVMASFSVSYIVFHFIVFYLILNWLNSPRLALLQMAVFTLATSGGFYWPNSEQIQGLSFVILYYAYFTKYQQFRSIKNGLMHGLMFAILLFYHPLMIFPMVFLFLSNSIFHWKIYKYELSIAGLFSLLWWFKRAFLPNWYDTMKGDNFNTNLETIGLKVYKLTTFDQLTAELFTKYHFIVLGAFLLLLFTFRIFKKWVFLVYVFLFCFGYFTIILIGEPHAGISFYIETNFYNLILFLFFPLLFYLPLPYLKHKLFNITASVLIAFSIFRMIGTAPTFTNRLNWIKDQMKSENCNKMYVLPQNIPENVRLFTWSMPHESLLLNRNSGGMWKSIHPVNQPRFDRGEYQDTIFVTDFNALSSDYINNRYFTFPVGEYCELTPSPQNGK